MEDINKAMQICHKNNVKVYPIYKDWKWYVEVSINGKKKRFDKPTTPRLLNDSITKTYIHYSNKL